MPKPIIDLRRKRVPNARDRDGSHDTANKGGLVMQVVIGPTHIPFGTIDVSQGENV